MRQGPWRSCLSSSHIYKMPRSLAEVCAQACASTSSGGEVSFVSPPLPQPEALQRHPRLPHKPQDRITPNTLCPSVLAADRFTHWLMPYGIAKLDEAMHLFPIHCIVRCRLLISKCVLHTTLSSYAAGLIHFTKFCDKHKVPEAKHIPASESLLSRFITICGTDSVGNTVKAQSLR